MIRLRSLVRRSLPTSARRGYRARIEFLEDRLALATVANVVSFSAQIASHGPYNPPPVDSSDNVYTIISDPNTLVNSLYGDSALIQDTIDGPGIASAVTGLDSSLALDASGNLFGSYQNSTVSEGVFESTNGSGQYQLLPDSINNGTLGENIDGLAVSGNNIYGATVGVVNGTDPTTGAAVQFPVVSVWQAPVAGGGTNTLLAAEEYPVSPFGELAVVGFTLRNNVLYGMTTGDGAGDVSVFSVPVGGGTFKVMQTFPTSIGSELAVTNTAVWGVTQSVTGAPFDTVFALPIGGGAPQFFSITAGTSAVGGLANDNGTLVGVLKNGSAAGAGPVVFAVNTTTSPPTMQDIASLTDIPLSGLTVDSQGNLFGVGTGEGPEGCSITEGEPSGVKHRVRQRTRGRSGRPTDGAGLRERPERHPGHARARQRHDRSRADRPRRLLDGHCGSTARRPSRVSEVKTLPGTYDLVAVAAGQSDPEPAVHRRRLPPVLLGRAWCGNPLWSNGQNWLGGISTCPAKGQVLTLRFSRRRPAKLQQR